MEVIVHLVVLRLIAGIVFITMGIVIIADIAILVVITINISVLVVLIIFVEI